MSEAAFTSTNPFEYDILIRKRGPEQYASYCPQLNYMLTGTEHEEVHKRMQDHILEHIEKMKTA